MRARTRLIDGSLCLVRRAEDESERALLDAERCLVETLAHPGFGAIVTAARPRRGELVLAHGGAVGLSHRRPPAGVTPADLLAGVAALVAELHAAGFALGGVTPDRIRVGSDRVHLDLTGAVPASPTARAADSTDLAQLANDLTGRALDAHGQVELSAAAVAVALASGRVTSGPSSALGPTVHDGVGQVVAARSPACASLTRRAVAMAGVVAVTAVALLIHHEPQPTAAAEPPTEASAP